MQTHTLQGELKRLVRKAERFGRVTPLKCQASLRYQAPRAIEQDVRSFPPLLRWILKLNHNPFVWSIWPAPGRSE